KSPSVQLSLCLGIRTGSEQFYPIFTGGLARTDTKKLYGNQIIEAACMAHVRRKFHDVIKLKPSPIAEEALSRIGALYDIENRIRGMSADERRTLRQQHARPILDELKAWIEATLSTLPQKQRLAEAMRYALSRWTALGVYIDDGRVEIDNNIAERAMRPLGTRVSLCTPYSSICKHWKRVLIDRATRAPLSGDRGFYRVGRKVRRPDLIRRAWNDLYGGKDIGLDKAANGMVRYAKRSGSLQHGQPFATFLSR